MRRCPLCPTLHIVRSAEASVPIRVTHMWPLGGGQGESTRLDCTYADREHHPHPGGHHEHRHHQNGHAGQVGRCGAGRQFGHSRTSDPYLRYRHYRAYRHGRGNRDLPRRLPECPDCPRTRGRCRMATRHQDRQREVRTIRLNRTFRDGAEMPLSALLYLDNYICPFSPIWGVCA